jgi:hypothetical protein
MIKFVNLPPLTQEEKDAIHKDAQILYSGSHNPYVSHQFEAYEFGRHHERYLASQEKQKLLDETTELKKKLEGCYEIFKLIAKASEHQNKRPDWQIIE